tara:strand:+ start:334 stop:1500 length:1167 start_codon:yes stop_codon:yes gene_type:complete
MNKTIFYGKHSIDKKDIESVKKTLNSNFLTTGNKPKEFETKFKKFVGSKYAISCNSGTSAIFLVALCLNFRKGDNIIIPDINFVAAANISKFFSCNIYFADVDKKSGQMSPLNLMDCIKKNNLRNIKAFFTMPLGGLISDTEFFFKIKKKYNCYWIEDACHALGSKYNFKGKYFNCGNSKHSNFSIFSFHPIKAITTFEGGMITTNSKKFYEKLKLYRSHGIKRSKFNWKYDVIETGFNFRLSDVACSVGISQLNKLKKFIKKRNQIAKYYFRTLKKIPEINFTFNKFPNYNSWHLFIILINFENLKISKLNLLKKLRLNGIVAQINYIPTSSFSNFKKDIKIRNTNSICFFKKALSIPIYYELTHKEQKYISLTIQNLIISNIKKRC